MELNPIQSNYIQKTDNTQSNKAEYKYDDVQKEIIKEKFSPVNSGLLKAYSGIANESISKDYLFDFLRNSGLKNSALFESVAAAISDKDGVITLQSFNMMKSLLSKVNIFYVKDFFLKSRNEDGINFKALKALDSVIPPKSSCHQNNDYSRFLLNIKDKDLRFNDEILDIILNNSESFKLVYNKNELIPVRFFKSLKNNDNDFDKKAIEFAKEEIKNGKEFYKLIETINEAKDENGNFSVEKQHTISYLKSLFSGYKLALIKNIIENLPKDNQKTKAELLNFAKENKDDRLFEDILEILNHFVSDSETKTHLSFNNNSVTFIKKFDDFIIYKKNQLISALKTINKPFEGYTKDEVDIVKSLIKYTFEPEETKAIIEAAKVKNGPKKGAINFDNIPKYNAILNYTRKDYKDRIVQDFSKMFELEENTKALDLLQKLMDYKANSRIGWNYLPGNEAGISLVLSIFKILCKTDENGNPTQKCNEQILEKLENIISNPNYQNTAELDNELLRTALGIEDEKIEFNANEICYYIFANTCGKNIIELFDEAVNCLQNSNINSINIGSNKNTKTIAEISYKDGSLELTKFFDIQKSKTISESKTIYDKLDRSTINKDYLNNTETEQNFEIQGMNGNLYEFLKSQKFRQYDNAGNLLFTEILKPSQIKDVYDISKVHADGTIEKISRSIKTKYGTEVIEKNMTSFDGTKSYYRFEDDPDGNRIMDYKIVDKTGKILLDQSITFAVIDDNHFISSRNGKSFDIKIDGQKLFVTNEQTGEKVMLDLSSFTQNTQDKILPILKKIPGDELFKMKELDLQYLYLDNDVNNACFNSYKRTITTSEDFLDLGVILHEWGHGKDDLMFKEIKEKINEDKKLLEIYNQEKELFKKNMSESQLSLISYFTADHHYLGDKAVSEGIAETNAILNISPKNKTQSIRAHYWQQYFPRTIAYLATLLN